MEATIAESIRSDLVSIFEQMAERHPAEPHWYLPRIAWIRHIKGKVTVRR